MANRKIFVFIIGFILLLYGCTKNNNEYLESFSVDKAKEIVIDYMINIQKGNISESQKLITDELISNSKMGEDNNSNIVSFVPSKITEMGNGAYVQMLVLKMNNINPRCDLDKYTFKVINNKNDYKIEEINTKNIKEIFAKGKDLRMITSDVGSDDVVLRIVDLPIDIYPKTDSSKINKEKVPSQRFERIGISYSGSKIAFSTTDGKDSFIGLAMVEESNFTLGKLYERNTLADVSTVDENVLEEVFEKPIVQKIIGYDILKGIEIKKMFFTEDENELIVQYSKRGIDSLGLKIYKNPDGTPIDINLENIFPIEKYNIIYDSQVGGNITISVDKVNGVKDSTSELAGRYIINLNDKTIDKI